MSLRDSIKSDSDGIFLNSSEFAEDVTYVFRAGGSRSIKALVDRDPPDLYDAAGNVIKCKYIVKINNSDTLGVEPDDIDTGGDEMEILKKFGGATVEQVSVLVVLAQDMGMVELALR